MSLNFSIDSILRHSNESNAINSSLLSSGKLNQANFFDESTSAFLKKQLNSHPQLNSYLTSNGSTNGQLTNQLNKPNSTSLLQSPLFYLNNKSSSSINNNSNHHHNSTTAALNLMDTTIGSTEIGSTPTNSNTFAFELNQLNQLSHLNPLELSELSRLNQLSHLQFQNQLTQFQSQLVVPYLSKINSLYNDNNNSFVSSGLRTNASCLNDESNGRPNSDHHSFIDHPLNSNHHLHHKLSNSSSNLSSKQKTAFLNHLTNANGTSSAGALFNHSNSGFNTTESQCSPLSDKSSELLLNYEDSSDSNHMSQHSGNNVSINSNSSNPSNKQLNSLNSSNNNSFNKNNKDPPLCTKCKLHGIRNYVKGHKKNCPKKNCACKLCILTDIGKRLRGKGSKKANALLASTSAAVNSTQANLLMMDGLKAASNLNSHNLSNLNNLNNLKRLSNNISDSGTQLVPNVGILHQSTTPNSNSNSSDLSMSNALAAATASLRNSSQPVSTIPSTNHSSILSQQLSTLHPGLGLIEKNAIKEYMKIVMSLLKDKLAQDGLNYEQELSKLKFTVIYLLLNRMDKAELFSKFITNNF